MKKGQKLSEESKRNISEAIKAKYRDPVTRAKYLEARKRNRGAKRSDETRAKMSESGLKRYEKLRQKTPYQNNNPLKLINISIKEKGTTMNEYTKNLCKDIKNKYIISSSTHVNRLIEVHFDFKTNNKEYLIVILKRYDIENPIFLHNNTFVDENFKNLFLSIAMKLKPKMWSPTDVDPEI